MKSHSVVHLSPLLKFLRSLLKLKALKITNQQNFHKKHQERRPEASVLHFYNFFTVNRKITRAKAALTGVFLSLFLQFAEISLMTFGVFFLLACVLEVVRFFCLFFYSHLE